MTRPDANFAPVGSGGNLYDFGSEEDHLVVDPLSDGFQRLWNSRARVNTEVFGQVFHPVPHDDVRTWKDYDEFYSHFFKGADAEATAGGAKAAETGTESEMGREEGGEKGLKPKPKPSMYKRGHVVAENFAPGQEGGMCSFFLSPHSFSVLPLSCFHRPPERPNQPCSSPTKNKLTSPSPPVRQVKELLSQVRGTIVEMPLLFLIKEDIAKEGVGLNAFTEVVYT